MIETLDAETAETALDDLAEVLHDCVTLGASVNFVLPYSFEDARAFWRRQLPALRNGQTVLFVARQDSRIAGTVMLGLDTPPNQRHRADVKKLLVHSRARRQGLARALMQAAESEARRRGLRLLTLDTEQGSDAETLYRDLGYLLAGVIPAYAMATDNSGLIPASFFYKPLD